MVEIIDPLGLTVILLPRLLGKFVMHPGAANVSFLVILFLFALHDVYKDILKKIKKSFKKIFLYLCNYNMQLFLLTLRQSFKCFKIKNIWCGHSRDFPTDIKL